MRKLKGLLNRNNNGDYIISDKGNSYNLSAMLNDYLMEDVKINIISGNGKGILFSKTGELLLEKVDKSTYKYSCDGRNFQGLLSDMVGRRIAIEINKIYDIDREDVS